MTRDEFEDSVDELPGLNLYMRQSGWIADDERDDTRHVDDLTRPEREAFMIWFAETVRVDSDLTLADFYERHQDNLVEAWRASVRQASVRQASV